MKGFLVFKAAAWLLPGRRGGGSSTGVRLWRGEGTGQGSGLARFGPSREDSGSRTRGGAEQGRRQRGRGAGVGSQVAGELGLRRRARARRGRGAGKRERHGGGVKVQPWVQGRDAEMATRGAAGTSSSGSRTRGASWQRHGWAGRCSGACWRGQGQHEQRRGASGTRRMRSGVCRTSSATRPLRGDGEGSAARARCRAGVATQVWSGGSGMRLCGSVSGEAHACGRVRETAWPRRSGELGQGVCRVLQAR